MPQHPRPIHTLLIPTRNRPGLIDVAVQHYLRSPREDVELIVADGSDDPQAVRQQLAPYLSDPRLRLLDHSPAQLGRVQAMRENWARGLQHCTGRWVTVVGDDDVLDPSLPDYLEVIEKRLPEAQAVSWQSIRFRHGMPEPELPAQIPVAHHTMVIDSKGHLERQLTWPSEDKLPEFGATLYHGALRLDLLERIRAERNGQYFRFATIDWDMAWTATHLTPAFVASLRPFSIMGHSEQSNSASVRRHAARIRAFKQWLTEDGALDGISLEYLEQNGIDPMFSFALPVTILGFRNAFAQAYGYGTVPLNKNNFLQTLILYCKAQDDAESFDWFAEQLRRFVRAFLGVAVPEDALRRPDDSNPFFYGVKENVLYFDRKLVNHDLRQFAPMAFRMIPHWKYCFVNKGGTGEKE